MSESAFKQPISLLLRQEWKRFGGKRRWASCSDFVRRHATTAAPAANRKTDPSVEIPWTQHHESTRVDPPSRQRLSQLREEINAPHLSSFLTDKFSRTHNYLRISVTERCNLRCLYCMPENGVPLSPPAHLLTTPEIVYLSQLFVSQGVDKIRLTGGEPTVRKDIVDLMKQIGQLRTSGLKELCLTTNGLTLYRKLDAMVEAGLTGVNLSLDTLDPYQFMIMTRRNGHDAVLRSIDRILEMKKHGAVIKLKINCVVMRGINEREIVPFVELGKDKDVEVRFIEYMPFDGNKWSEGKMLSFKEMLAMVRDKYPDLQKVQDHANDTSKTYQVPGFVGRLGFITSMTHNFCGTCNRLRITSDGNLKVCLFGNNEVSLRDILRETNNGEPLDQAAMQAIRKIEMDVQKAASEDHGASIPSALDNRLLRIIGAAVKRKKAEHAGIGELENMKNRPMILIDDHYSNSISPSCPSQYSQLPSLLPLERRPQSYANRDSAFQSTSSYIHLRQYRVGPERSREMRRQNARRQIQPKDLPKWLRTVYGQSTFRRTPSHQPESWITPTRVSKAELSGHVAVFGGPAYSKVHARAQAERKGINRDVDIKHDTKSSQIVQIKSTSEAKPSPLPGQSNYLKDSIPSLATSPSDSAAPPPDSAISSPGSTTFSPDSTTSPSDPATSSPNSATSPTPSNQLTHLTSAGEAHMVDISHKRPTRRAAAATAFVLFSNPKPYSALTDRALPKGDAIAVARIAGIQAAKKTSDLIPLAHPGLGITSVKVDIELLKPFTSDPFDNAEPDFGESSFEFGGVKITAYVSCDGKTGVEMEALTAANIAALTIYDMCKAVDKHMMITGIRVSMKKGGKSGDWRVNGDIPDDPPPSPIFQPVVERRMDGIITEPEYLNPASAHTPTSPQKTPRANDDNDSTLAPPPTSDFYHAGSTELNLFIANTTSPVKAAEIAALRRQHKAITAKIKEVRRRIEQGETSSGGPLIRDGRIDYDILQRLHRQRQEIASEVLGWRITGGSEIGEASAGEDGNGSGGRSGSVFDERRNEFERKAAPGEWRWEGGVYGVWKGDGGEEGEMGEVNEKGG